MTIARLEAAVPDGEALRYTATSRRGEGAVGLTDERLLLSTEGEEVVSASLTAVDEVTVQSFDWFLGVLSAGLVAFGIASLSRSLPAGVVFLLAGAASLWLTYRKRGRVTIRVDGRAKPLTVHLEDTDAFQDAFRGRVDAYEDRLAAER